MGSSSIFSEYQEIVNEWNAQMRLPRIAGIFAPSESLEKSGHKKLFGYIWLEDNSVGFMFTPLTADLPNKLRAMDPKTIIGKSPTELITNLGDTDELKQLIAFGALNAVSQHILSKGNLKLDFTTDPFGLLEITPQDSVGMVGYFPPLVGFCEQHGIPLTVIEKKAELVQQQSNFEVTLDSTRLLQCNKILITGTTVLNNTLDVILEQCKNSKKIAMVGPSASILPDPLFKRGVTVVGGSRTIDFNAFQELCRTNESWDPAVQKYCIQQDQYPGWKYLLENKTKFLN